MRSVALIMVAVALLGAAPLRAQHSYGAGQYDPAVPTPRSVLGYEIGERFTPHHLIMRYVERMAASSRRIAVETVAVTFEGREVLMIAATSEANRGRLAQIRADAARLADPRGATAADLAAALSRLPAVVWLGYTVHGGEASGTEAALALIYQLAAGRDEETRMVLDSTVVLIDPVQNPDGHERHVQDVMRNRGRFGPSPVPGAMIHQGNWPGPRTSHYYFDLNRDWFLLSHPETRGRVRSFHEWWPVVAVDLHEMGSNSTYYFAPPMAPVNKNVPANTRQWWDIFAAAIGGAFDRHGWSFFRREGYDEFYPGYGISWPLLAGAVGMTFEQASSSGGAIRRNDGTVLTLREAAHHHYTAAWATLVTTARRRTERVRDFLAFRQTAITDHERGPLRAVVIERDDQGRADSLVLRLLQNSIQVQRLRASVDSRDATEFGEAAARPTTRFAAGWYVVDFAQPQGRLAKALLEPDAELDSSFIREELESRRTGQPGRFYDITAWTLPLAFRVRAWATRTLPGPADPVTEEELTSAAPRPGAPAPARYGYAFRPGSEASLRLLAALLADSIRVWFAPRSFTQAGVRFAHGAFLVRVAMNRPDVHDVVRRHQAATGAEVVALSSAMADEGTDLGSNSVFPLRTPRVALVGGQPIFGNSFGFAWYAFEQRLNYAVTPVSAQNLPGLLDDFDVVVIPSVAAGAFDGVLGDSGRQRIQEWVRGGGTLITLDGATAWLAAERTGLARFRLRRDTVRADSAGGAPLPASVPGAVLRAGGDTLSALLAGVRTADIPVLMGSDRVYNPPRDLRAGEAVVRYARRDRLRMSGYLWPEMPERIAESVYLWTERVGRGRVIGFAGDPNFRDHFRGLLPLFANAVFLGPAM
ncbi:MAG TPA: M14 family metallopeptidase [Gemmatimonadales bacterium]|nr:M14 family metallopeptidase [Gemmatimonadales bacterium]